MEEDEIEYTLLNKNECMLYKIPPATAAGHKADDWQDCVWRGKLRISAKGNDLFIKFVHASGENIGSNMVEVKVVDGDSDKYVERATDSSRYFAIRVVDPSGAKKTFIGLGFKERNDAFDFNCTLQDFKNRNVVEHAEPAPSKDYSLKEGEKITVNFKGIKKKKDTTPLPSGGGGGVGIGFLPPPPSGNTRNQDQVSPLIPPPSAASAPTAAAPDTNDFFCDFQGFQSATTTSAPAFPPAAASAQPVQLSPATTTSGTGLGDFNFTTSPATAFTTSIPASFPAAPIQSSPISSPPIQAYTAAPPQPTQTSASFDPFAGFGNLTGAPPVGGPIIQATSTTVTSPAPPGQATSNNQIDIPDALDLDIFK